MGTRGAMALALDRWPDGSGRKSRRSSGRRQGLSREEDDIARVSRHDRVDGTRREAGLFRAEVCIAMSKVVPIGVQVDPEKTIPKTVKT